MEKFSGKKSQRWNQGKNITPPPRFFAEACLEISVCSFFFFKTSLIILTHDNVFLNRNIDMQSSKIELRFRLKIFSLVPPLIFCRNFEKNLEKIKTLITKKKFCLNVGTLSKNCVTKSDEFTPPLDFEKFQS
jgi:hypothetical protein